MKYRKPEGNGLKTSLLTICFAIFSFGGALNQEYSNIFFYVSIIGIIIFMTALYRTITMNGNKLLITASFIFAVSGVLGSYHFCTEQKSKNFTDTQHEVKISFHKRH